MQAEGTDKQPQEIILDNLYATFGTDSGILLGIKEREVVKTIVEFAIINYHYLMTGNVLLV